MDGILLQEIFEKDYADELIKLIRNNGNIEEFIKNIEATQRSKFLETDKTIVYYKQTIKKNKQNINEASNQINKLENEKNISLTLRKRIDEIKKTYPEQKTRTLEKYLVSIFTSEEKLNKENLISKPKNIFDRIIQGKSIKAGNKKLEQLLVFCKEHNISNLHKKSPIIQDVFKGYNINTKIEDINYHISKIQQNLQYYNNDVVTAEKTIQKIIDQYDSNDLEKSQYANQRKKQRQNIQSFADDYNKILKYPSNISKEEIKKSGLSEEFIERQILESRFPEKNLRSIRRSYENLDRPAAPMVAFARGAKATNGNLFSTEIADDIVRKLKEKGIDVVIETDPRAIDPLCFVVDKKSQAIYAPFLAPDDALKANITMIDAIYECGGEAARSSPRTIETFAIASHKNLSGTQTNTRVYELDLETVASHYSKQNYDRIMNDFFQEFADKCDYQALCRLMDKIKNNTPNKYDTFVKELQEKAKPYIDSNRWTNEHANKLSKEFITEHKEDMMPYIKKSYQDTMLQEAFEKGIDPQIPNKENLLMMEQNKPITSVFHAGQNGGLPYSILSADKRMSHIYGATTLAPTQLPEAVMKICGSSNTGGALGYAFGQSSHDKKCYTTQKRFGFVYEYESRKEKQEIVFLENCGGTEVESFKDGKYDLRELSHTKDETAILPHQNKLKKIYIAIKNNDQGKVSTRLFPLELDENGQIKDKRWNDFVKLHNPVDDTLVGLMVERQNNMIADYNNKGKEKIMDKCYAQINQATPLQTTMETLKDTMKKDAVKAGASMGKVVDGMVSGISKADNAVNQAIDTVIDKGSKALNNTSVGKAYTKVSDAVSNTKVVKAVEKATAEVGEKVAQSAVGKAVTKTVAKTVGKTVAKTSGTAVVKSLVKKLPIVSLGAGLYFAYDRIKDGDWKGACGEVASGALGCFPGLGTAASAAIDVGLAAKDISEVVSENKSTEATTEEKNVSEVANQHETKSEVVVQQGQLTAEAKPRSQVSPQQINAQVQRRMMNQGR